MKGILRLSIDLSQPSIASTRLTTCLPASRSVPAFAQTGHWSR